MSKILLVEDEKMLADMYRDRFEAEGIETAVAYDAKEALDYLGREKPDLILLDILLPKENGISLLQKLHRQKKNLPPVVAFSNYDEVQTKKESERLGVKEYLIKTQFTPAEIVAKIKSYLSGGA